MQVLGVGFGIAVAFGNTISAGIVRTPGDIAARLPNMWWFFGVWFGGALYALVSAFQLAELGAAVPRSGGQYNFARLALGDYAGFLVGWGDWLSLSGSTGTVGIVIGEYAARLFPALAGGSAPVRLSPALVIFIPRLKITAVTVIALFAVLQCKSIDMGSKVQNFTTVLKGLAFLIFVVACFVVGGHVPASSLAASLGTSRLPAGAGLLAALLFGLQATIYTYDGWDGVIYFGDEIKNPGRMVPRAIFGSLLSVSIIYMMIIAAVVHVLPMSDIAGNDFSLGLAAERVLGAGGDVVFRSIMIVSLCSSLNAVHLMSTRVIYALSRDGLFFRCVSHVNKGGTPTVGLLLSTLVGITFTVFTFERVVAVLTSFYVTNYMLSFISMFLLRWREPELPRPFLAWGYPWTTALALLGSVAILAAALRVDRTNGIFALVALVCSYPAYRAWRIVSVCARSR